MTSVGDCVMTSWVFFINGGLQSIYDTIVKCHTLLNIKYQVEFLCVENTVMNVGGWWSCYSSDNLNIFESKVSAWGYHGSQQSLFFGKRDLIKRFLKWSDCIHEQGKFLPKVVRNFAFNKYMKLNMLKKIKSIHFHVHYYYVSNWVLRHFYSGCNLTKGCCCR